MTPGLLTDTVSPDVRRATEDALMWGLECVALRTVGRERVPYTNEARLRRVLTEGEMPVAWIDPGLFEGSAGHRAGVLSDIESLREIAPFSRRLECDLVAVGALAAEPREADAVVDSLRQLGETAQSLGLRVAVRNGDAAPSGLDLAALVRATDHPAVGALWSPAASRAAGEDGAAVARALASSRLFGVEADALFAEAEPGASGMLALAEAGYEGSVVLAFETLPESALGVSTSLIRGIRQARRATR